VKKVQRGYPNYPLEGKGQTSSARGKKAAVLEGGEPFCDSSRRKKGHLPWPFYSLFSSLRSPKKSNPKRARSQELHPEKGFQIAGGQGKKRTISDYAAKPVISTCSKEPQNSAEKGPHQIKGAAPQHTGLPSLLKKRRPPPYETKTMSPFSGGKVTSGWGEAYAPGTGEAAHSGEKTKRPGPGPGKLKKGELNGKWQ